MSAEKTDVGQYVICGGMGRYGGKGGREKMGEEKMGGGNHF